MGFLLKGFLVAGRTSLEVCGDGFWDPKLE